MIVAAAIGIAALLAIRSYVNRIEAQTEAKLKGEPVVAASVDIPAGTVITLQMLTPKEVPHQFIPAQAIQGSDQVKQIIGNKTRYAIQAGQIILWSDLASESHGGLSAIIPEGQEAFTVTISKGVTPGLLQPSDHIDIIGSFAIPKATQPLPGSQATWRQGSDLVNVVLLQNVTVLAVGNVVGGAARAQGDSSSGDLTLSLTLPEAQLLMFASQNGELGAVLRREGVSDVQQRSDLPRVTFQEIEKIIGDLDGRRNYHNVEIQKGSESTTVPVLNPASQNEGQK